MMVQADIPAIAAILQSTGAWRPFPTRTEREPWERFRGQALAAQILARAEQALTEPPPPIPATAYLAFYRNGQRHPYETPARIRRQRLSALALAECLQAEERFSDALLDEAWAICEESTWVASAHSSDYPHQLYDPTVPLIDLYSARTALALAEIDYLLGDLLHPALRQRIRHEVARRGMEAFLARDDYWWLGNGSRQLNNWTAVCVGATAGAALYLEPDLNRLSAVIAKALAALQRYLQTFGADGASNEGVGYWEFGFGYFVLFAHLLAERTGGRIDLLDNPHARQIAAFPAQVELSPGSFVAFSDTGLARRPQPALLHFLARRYSLPQLVALDHDGPHQRVLSERGPAEQLRDLFWYPAEVAPVAAELPPARYFPDVQWLIARANPADPDGLVLAAKAGNNAESHNQNDVGSFMLHWRRETLIAELGAGRYTRDYFRPELRYTMLPNASRGHSVPQVNGHEQRAGTAYQAVEVEHISTSEQDTLVMDLAPAYPPEADLASLRRRVSLRRTGEFGRIELDDMAVFRDAPGSFKSALITFGQAIMHEPGHVHLAGARGGLTIRYDPEQARVRIEEIADVDLRDGPWSVTRITFAMRAPAREARITLELTPGVEHAALSI